MTQKQLLYLEDAIGHEKNIICILNESISQASSKRIVNFLNSELSNHEKLYNSLLKHMEVVGNEWSINNG